MPLTSLPPNWPRPLRLICAALALNGGAREHEGAQSLARDMTPEDWDRFGTLAIREHRVAPLIAPALAKLDGVPGKVRDLLAQTVRQNAIRTLVQIAETRRISADLAAIGAEPVVLKGWPLGAGLFGDASQRDTGDLDLLIPRAKVWEACDLLGGLGYLPSEHSAKMRRRAKGVGNDQLLQAVKDIELVNSKAGVVLELHWQLLHYHGWPDFLARPDSVIRQQSQAGPVLVPGAQANLMFLSTHGSLHLWERLKWLLDIVYLAQARGTAALEQDLDLARSTGIARPVILALCLAGRLFGSPVPQGAHDPAAARLERWILGRMGNTQQTISGMRYQLGVRRMALGLAKGWHQSLGVIGYDTTRRLRLISLNLRR